jgi:dihydrofolate reductase
MGRIVVTEFISLDGVVEAPGGEDFKYPGWTFEFDRGDDGNQFKLDETLGTEALLIGRRTYESFAGAWPERDGPFAEKFNTMPKYVVSGTLTDPDWNNTTVITGDVPAQAAALKERVDGDIQVPGSIRLVQELIEHDLVDEIHLMTFPVILGTGRRLFGETTDRSTWKLAEATTVGEGIPVTIFQRAGR